MSISLAVPNEDRIRAVAYALWLEEGQPDGRAESHWLKANELVNTDANRLPAATVAASPKRAAAPKPAQAAAKTAAPRKRS